MGELFEWGYQILLPLFLKALSTSALLPFHLQVQKNSNKKFSNQMEKE